MADNNEINLHRNIINSLLHISLERQLTLAAFNNLLKQEIDRLRERVNAEGQHNIFRVRILMRISILSQLQIWIDHRLQSVISRL